jgi:hypothetical protein
VLRTLFGLHGRVDRRVYLVTGISLMLLKYALDATAIYLIAHVVWTPLDYLVWYRVAIYPQGYCRGASEMLLHGIHRRVLEQVKRESELASAGSVALAGGGR